MEEIIEELRELAEDISTPLELPDEDDVVEIEEQLLISIPYDLRYFLLEASDIVYGNIEPVTIADPRSHTHLPEVTAEAWQMGLPREFIVICEYDGGYGFIEQDGKVGFWTEGDIAQEWESLWHWVRDVWVASSRS